MDARGRRWTNAAWLIVALALAAAPAVAQDESAAASEPIATVPAPVREALDQLTSPQWTQRDAAQQFLLRQPLPQVPRVRSEIEERLLAATDPELVTRLRHIALHLYLKEHTALAGQAALLGIALNLEAVRPAPGEDVQMCVSVQELKPGFDAAEKLRVGDRIIGLGKQKFDLDLSVEAFRREVNSQRPGDTLHLMVLRGRETVAVAVVLAGVEEAGVSALSNYMQDRDARAALYIQELRARGRSSAGLVVEDRGDPMVPPIKDPRRAE